ncbi:hypothetical protein OBA27_00655 [Pelagibacteraceae bacterium]|nr:hypothetical protein [Pelagibacteraceae bacterium]
MNNPDKDYIFNVRDYFNEIIYQRKILILILIIASIISSILYFLHEEKYEVSLNIGKIKIINTDFINILNEYEEMVPINREYLRELFIEELLDRNEIISALNYYKDSRYNDNLEKLDLKRESNKFFVKKKLEDSNIDSENIENRDLYIITLKTKNLTDLVLIFKKFMEDTNVSVKKHIISDVERFSQIYEKKRIIKINDTLGLIEFKKEEFLQSLNDKLILLEKEYEIAVNLGIENSIADQYFGSEPAGVQNFNTNKETYLEGYLILEKRINIIKRQIMEKIVPNTEQLRSLNSNLKSYQEDDLSNRIIEDYKNSNFLDKDLALVDYDINRINTIKSNISKKEIFLFTIILGIVFCFIFSLFSVWIRNST